MHFREYLKHQLQFAQKVSTFQRMNHNVFAFCLAGDCFGPLFILWSWNQGVGQYGSYPENDIKKGERKGDNIDWDNGSGDFDNNGH